MTSGQETVDQSNGTTNGQSTVNHNNGTTNNQNTVNSSTQNANTPAPVGGNYDNTGSADRSMPRTAGNWLGMLMEGGVLGGLGLALRRILARG